MFGNQLTQVADRIVTDADGVLFKSMHFYTEVFSQALFELSSIPIEDSKSYFLRSSGIDLTDQISHMLSAHNKPLDGVKQVEEYFWDRLRKETPPLYDDVLDALKSLKREGYVIDVVSGTLHDILESRVEDYGLKEFLHNWVGKSEYNSKKAYLEFLDKDREKLLGEGGRIYFVGDGLEDMKLARSFRMVGIGIIREDSLFDSSEMKKAGAMEVIRSLRDLEGVVKKRY